MIADFLNVSAIGLIETKLPDGSDGFSLLVIITADFGAGIQLGYGFTLLAVGGLLGLNRAMLFQPIMDGIRTNAITSVLFPQNVIPMRRASSATCRRSSRLRKGHSWSGRWPNWVGANRP